MGLTVSLNHFTRFLTLVVLFCSAYLTIAAAWSLTVSHWAQLGTNRHYKATCQPVN